MEKTKQEIRVEMLNKLKAKTGINTDDEGTIALAIIDSVLDEVWTLYQKMDMMKQQAYLSSSQGEFTEKIAHLVGTDREQFESDEELKRKVSTSVQRNAKGNKMAIEEAAMQVSGVASIDYRPFGAGTGSFVMYIYPVPGMNQLRLLDEVEKRLEDIVSDGIYFEVKAPTEVPVHVTLLTEFEDNLTQMEKQVFKKSVEFEVRKYLNGLRRDEVMYVNEVVKRAMNVSEHIKDVAIIELTIGKVKKHVTNTFPANDERFISGDIKSV